MFSLAGKWAPRLGVALLCCLSLPPISSSVSAQGTTQYKSDPIAPDLRDKKNYSKLKSACNRILRGSNAYDTSFDRWYVDRWFPLMTSPANIGGLSEARRTLLKELNACADNSEVHTRLTKLIYDFGRKVAQQKEKPEDNYHPAVRFNGVLLLGQLNDQEAQLSANRRPPIPYSAAFGTLVGYAADEKLTDVVRLAALLGVKRHVELRTKFPQVAGQITPQQQSTVLRNMAKLVATEQPPAGLTRGGHDWMRSIAAETLGLFGVPGSNDIVVQVLNKLVGQSDASLSTRCAAAKALGQIDFGTSKPNATAIINPSVRLAADCCQTELRILGDLLADEAAAAETGGRRRDAGNALFGSEEGAEEDSGSTFLDPRSVPTRRRLLSQLLAIREGLMGPDGKSGLSKIAANEVRSPVQQIDAILASLRAPATDIRQLNDALAKQSLEFEKLAGSTAGTPAADPPPTATAAAPQ